MPFDGLSISQIPIVLRGGVYVYQDNTLAVSGLYTNSYKILMLGQMLPSGLAVPNTPLQVGSAGIAAMLFGYNSMLHIMAKRIFDQGLGAGLQLYAIAQQDAVGSAAATGSIVVSGPATANGTIALYVGGERVTIGVTQGESAASIASAIVVGINAISTYQYFTAAIDGANTAKVDLTAIHKGAVYNGIDLRDSYFNGEALPQGVGLAYTTPSGGATNPTLANAIAAMGAIRWNKVAMPYLDGANMTALSTELLRRFQPMVQLDGMAHAWSNDTLSNLLALGTGQDTQFISCVGIQGVMAPGFALAARYTALAAVSAQADPARQLRTLPLANEFPPSPAVIFTDDENENLLQDGVAAFDVGDDGLLHNLRAVTFYKTNAQGIPDPSYRDVETFECLAALRADIRGYVATAYPNWKLADDGPGTTPGQGIMTPSFMKSALQNRGFLWAQLGLIQDYNQFVAALQVTRDANDVDRLNALIQPTIINNFRTLAVDNQFKL